MISALHLLWVIPTAVLFGVLLTALIVAGGDDRS